MKASLIQNSLKEYYQELSNDSKAFNLGTQKHYLLADKIICINYANSLLFSHLSSAISHLEVNNSTESADLTLWVFDSASPPQVPRELILEETMHMKQTESHPIFYFNGEDYLLTYQLNNGLREIQFFNKRNREAFVWIRDIKEVLTDTSEVLTSPFRTIFAWFFSLHDKVLLHSAGAGEEDGGVLFIGPGGSGKTTSALSCLASGYKFSGDDSILVSAQENPIGYSVYKSARLFKNDLDYFQPFRNLVLNPNDPPDEKVRFLLNEDTSKKLLSAFPIKAIIAPTIIEKDKAPLLEAIKPAEALRILAPSTLLHIPGQNQKTLHNLAKIVSSIPCYRLTLNGRTGTGDIIRKLLVKH